MRFTTARGRSSGAAGARSPSHADGAGGVRARPPRPHPEQVVDRAESALLGARLEDAPGEHRADPGSQSELRGARTVEIEQRASSGPATRRTGVVRLARLRRITLGRAAAPAQPPGRARPLRCTTHGRAPSQHELAQAPSRGTPPLRMRSASPGTPQERDDGARRLRRGLDDRQLSEAGFEASAER